jgi:hypothetical protein
MMNLENPKYIDVQKFNTEQNNMTKMITMYLKEYNEP